MKKHFEDDGKLKELAIKAGVKNNFKRARDFNRCYAWNCGDGVVKSEVILSSYL